MLRHLFQQCLEFCPAVTSHVLSQRLPRLRRQGRWVWDTQICTLPPRRGVSFTPPWAALSEPWRSVRRAAHSPADLPSDRHHTLQGQSGRAH